jgi:hypothetical protein
MSIINTNTKSWEDNTISLDGTPPYPSLEVTVQTDSDSNYAYFFGGRFNSVRGKFLNNTLEILDLKNNRWLKTNNQHETGAIIKQRYFSSSAIIDGNFITAFGNTL